MLSNDDLALLTEDERSRWETYNIESPTWYTVKFFVTALATARRERDDQGTAALENYQAFVRCDRELDDVRDALAEARRERDEWKARLTRPYQPAPEDEATAFAAFETGLIPPTPAGARIGHSAGWAARFAFDTHQMQQAERALADAHAENARGRRLAAAWDATLSSYCDGPERDALRAWIAPTPRPAAQRDVADSTVSRAQFRCRICGQVTEVTKPRGSSIWNPTCPNNCVPENTPPAAQREVAG